MIMDYLEVSCTIILSNRSVDVSFCILSFVYSSLFHIMPCHIISYATISWPWCHICHDMTPYGVMPDHIPLFLGNNLLLREHLSLQPVWQQLQGKTYSTIFICNFHYIHLLPKLIVFDCHKYSYNLSSASARGYSVGDKLRKEFPSYWPGFSRYWTGKPEKTGNNIYPSFLLHTFAKPWLLSSNFYCKRFKLKNLLFTLCLRILWKVNVFSNVCAIYNVY